MKKSPVDIVLSDVSLAGNEDGLDLVRWMRKTKTWQKTPVIATTAHAFTKDRDNCLAAGCNDYLSKPIKRENLFEQKIPLDTFDIPEFINVKGNA